MKLPFAPAAVATPKTFDSINEAAPTQASIVAMPQKTTALTNVSPEVKAELDVLAGLNRLNIHTYGHGGADEVAQIADEVCARQTASKMGEIGTHITSIIKLTQNVNADDFNLDKSKGMFDKAVGWFKSAKVDVESHYKSTSDQIGEIAEKLETSCTAAQSDNEFLELQHQAVQRQYLKMGVRVEALEIQEKIEQAKVDAAVLDMEKRQSQDALELQLVQDQRDYVTKINKQADRIRRLQHLVLLQLPTIRATQSGNLDAMDDLTMLREETLPMWKSLIGTAAMGMRLKERVALSGAVKDHTNTMARQLAEMTGQNMVDVAKMSQRSSVDIETLKHYQKTIITKGREAQKAIEAGAKERADAIPLIAGMRDELRKEYSNKK